MRLALLAVLGFAVLAHPPAALRADVAEWSIVPSDGVVAAGPVKITVRNLGDLPHRILLVKTRGFDDRLPLKGDHVVVHPIAASPPVAPASSASFTVSLRPGYYLLLDNGPWAYWHGMSVAFTVR
jgi:uncharacterized cupredoxin-like copper-binding protein